MERRTAAVLSRCLTILALLGQLLLPVMAVAQPLAGGDTLVICTPQGFRSVSVDPATPDQPSRHHRCDFCCLGPCAGGLPPAAIAVAFPLGGAVRVAAIRPSASPSAGTPRYQRPQGRAPPLHLV
jgi:hypothetical protein